MLFRPTKFLILWIAASKVWFFWSVFTNIRTEYGVYSANLRVQSEYGKIKKDVVEKNDATINFLLSKGLIS